MPQGNTISTFAIIPAAGSSTRMGRSKLTLPFGETTILGATIGALRDGGAEAICVVGRSDDEEIATVAAEHDCAIATNLQPEHGMLSSVIAGLDRMGGVEELAKTGRSLLVSPGDLPQLQTGTVRAVLKALEIEGCDLAVPRFGGRTGHPLAIAPGLIDRIQTLAPSIGLRQIKQLEGIRLVEVDCDDRGCVHDVDTQDDYRRALGRRDLP